jgi:large conductance mechanosensitive channel
MGMIDEFRTFAVQGNVMDLAVGIIIGGGFQKIVNSLVNDVIMPPIGLVLGKTDFSSLFIDLSGKGYATLAEAKKANAPTLNYGAFANTVIEFIIVAFVVFMLVKWMNRMRGAAPPPVK